MKQPETIFKEKVLKALACIPNGWFTKIQQVAIRGTPDILGCVNGFFIALELKKNIKEKPEPLQEYTLTKISICGKGISFVASPENWEDILNFINWLSTSKMAHAMNEVMYEKALSVREGTPWSKHRV